MLNLIWTKDTASSVNTQSRKENVAFSEEEYGWKVWCPPPLCFLWQPVSKVTVSFLIQAFWDTFSSYIKITGYSMDSISIFSWQTLHPSITKILRNIYIEPRHYARVEYNYRKLNWKNTLNFRVYCASPKKAYYLIVQFYSLNKVFPLIL